MKKNNNNQVALYLSFSISFFILLCLSCWQLNKHIYKSKEKDYFFSNLEKEPRELNNFNIKINNLEIIKIKGEILEKKSLFLEPRTYKGKIGYHKLVPLKIGEKFILVNKGFTFSKENNEENKVVRVKGIIINFPKPRYFDLRNDFINNIWHTLEINEISEFLNIKLEPFILYEINKKQNETFNVRPNLVSNINHLNYSITWFLLAITLSIIFVINFRKS